MPIILFSWEREFLIVLYWQQWYWEAIDDTTQADDCGEYMYPVNNYIMANYMTSSIVSVLAIDYIISHYCVYQ